MNNMSIQLKEFDGPLDLLLTLISEKKMEISDVSLSEVTEQFLSYLDTLEKIEADELADFLVVASKLLFLKSKSLLPELAIEEDEGLNLEDQLKLYRHFLQASKKVSELWNDRSQIGYTRMEPIHISEEIVCPDNFFHQMLHTTMYELVRRLAPPKALPRTHIDKTISLKEKINTLRALLTKNKQTTFKNFLSKDNSRTGVIVSFLALLEMVKQKRVSLHQDMSFDDIIIKKV